MGGGQQQCNTWATFSFFLQQRRKNPHDTVYSVSRELRVGDGCLGTSWWTELWWNVMCPALWRTEPRTLVFTSHPGSIQVLSACWEVSFGSHGWFTVSDQCWLWACGMEGGRAALSYLSPYCVKDCSVPGPQQCVGFCLLSKLCLKVLFREFWCSAVHGASVAKWFGHHSSFQLLETVWCCWAELMVPHLCFLHISQAHHCLFSGWDHSSALRLDHSRQSQACRSGAWAHGDWVGFSLTLTPSPSFLQSLQKDKMGEAYSEIGKKGEVSPSYREWG